MTVSFDRCTCLNGHSSGGGSFLVCSELDSSHHLLSTPLDHCESLQYKLVTDVSVEV